MSQSPYNHQPNNFGPNASPNYMPPPPSGNFQQYQPPEKKFPCAIVAIIFGIFGFMALIGCGGFLAILINRDASNSQGVSIIGRDTTDEFEDMISMQLNSEVVIGGAYNQEFVSELRNIDSVSARFMLQEHPHLEEITAVLNDISQTLGNDEDFSKYIDSDAAVERLEEKGIKIDDSERTSLGISLKEKMILDGLGSSFKVIQIKPIALGKGVRVLVANDSHYDIPPFLSVFWFRNTKDGWKVYDLLDLSTSLGKIDYFKTLFELSGENKYSFGELTTGIVELSENEELSYDKKLESINELRTKYPLPRKHQRIGNEFLAYYYCAYGAEGELEQLLRKMTGSKTGTDLPFRAWLQYRQNKPEKLFKTLSQIETIFGWHPALGRFAPHIPNIGGSQFKAVQWMTKSALIFPEQFRLGAFLSFANEREIDRLISIISNTKDAKQRIAQIENNSYFIDGDNLKKWTAALSKEPKFRPHALKGQFRIAASDEDYESATQIAASLLETDLSDSLFESVGYQLLECGIETKSLDLLFASSKHPNRFMQYVAESAAYQYRVSDKQIGYVSDFCERHIRNIENGNESIVMCLVRSRIVHISGNYDTAINLLLPVIKRSWQLNNEPQDNREERTFADSDEEFLATNFYTIANTLMQFGTKSPGRLSEVLDAIPNRQASMLAACATPDLDSQSLELILDWYGKGAENFEVWSHYYRAQIAAKDGDYDSAISLYEKSIGPTLGEDWTNEISDSPFAYNFAPFEDDLASEVRSLQFNLAAKSNSWNQLLKGFAVEDKKSLRWKSLVDELLWRFSESHQQTLMVRLRDFLKEIDSPNDYAQLLATYFEGRLALLQGSLPDAAKRFRQTIKLIEQSEADIFTYHVYSGLVKCVLDDSVELTDQEMATIEELSLTSQLALNLAIVENKKWEELDRESYSYDYMSPSPLQRKIAERSQNMDDMLITLKGNPASGSLSEHGAILLDSKIANLPGKLRRLMQSAAGFEEFGRYENGVSNAFENDILAWESNHRVGPFEQLDASRFPGYSHVYRTTISASVDNSKHGGWLIAGIVEEPEKLFENSDDDANELPEQVIALQLLDDRGIADPVAIMRQYGLLLTDRLGESSIFYDGSTKQVFDQGSPEIANAMRGETYLATGKSLNLYSYNYVANDEVDDRTKIIRSTLFTELISVRPKMNEDSVRLIRDSQILPWLKTDMIISK